MSGFYVWLDAVYKDTLSFMYFHLFAFIYLLLSYVWAFFFFNLGKDHINLMLDFAGWVLDANPEEGLKMFTEDIAEVEQLPRPKVLDYLLRTHKDLVIPYLVTVWHCYFSWVD